MPLDAKLEHHLQRLLTPSDNGSPHADRLLRDAQRLYRRVQRFLSMNLAPPDIDLPPLELACHALQLPLRQAKPAPAGKLGQISLPQRAQLAANLTAELLADYAGRDLADRTTNILRELPLRKPSHEETMLLADAVNLDDFGVTGLILQAMQLARQNATIDQVADGFDKRQQYGYWDARLKDGFHFEPIRQIARQRLQTARHSAALLIAELQEDHCL
jgi:hypothetical protein